MACDGETPTAPGSDPSIPTPEFSSKKVVHQVSVGGADLCEAAGLPTGCDKNYSLVASERADGSVKGQWQDRFKEGVDPSDGIHVAVDCLNVVGNGAVIGGVITHGTLLGADLSGQRALTAVVDNGTSANDPPDQIAPSFTGTGPLLCTDLDPIDFALAFFALTHGQVKVR